MALAACACLCAAGVANATYVSDFEDLDCFPGGTILTGQDGYYLPPGTDSTDFFVFKYVGNPVNLPQNPEGGDQFVSGTGPGSPTFARAQRDVDWGDGTETWIMTYDFAATYVGQGASAQNIGSVSVMSSLFPDIDYIHLFTWVDPNDPVSFNAFYMAYDVNGTQFAQPGESPGPAWENLPIDHWFRASMILELPTNLIIEVGIIDLETMEETIYYPTDWYLEGGAGGGVGPPINFRFFGGGSVAGNTTAFDNISIVVYEPTPIEETTWGQIKSQYK
jgi:hypothetical protein